MRGLKLVAAAALLLATTVGGAAAATPIGPSAATRSAEAATKPVAKPDLRVVGNHLLGKDGKAIRLLGVDKSGTEYACAQGWGIFDGPNTKASVEVMKSWHINAVRLPLNEGCWLGVLSGTTYQGPVYRKAIKAFVKVLRAQHIYVILELSGLDESQPSDENVWPMADEQYSPRFWASMGKTFKNTQGVLFDLYNEPHNISWKCWLSGCAGPLGYRTAGMQQMVNSVRSSGAKQPIMLGGLDYSSDLSGWRKHEPHDPDHQLIASFHTYNFSGCNVESCWNSTLSPLAKKVPVVAGEIGENDCKHGYIDTYMKWADAHGVSYLGWTWDSGGGWSCKAGPTLITSYDGTPTRFGRGLKNHLAQLAKAREKDVSP